MGKLEGKVAVVTGAARGSGEATARRFVSEGARVVIADVRDDRGESTAKDLGEAALYQHCDVTKESDWDNLIARTVAEFGALNILVNNAGVCRLVPFRETTLEVYRLITDVNQLGTFLGIRSAIDPMRDAGGGSIVNVSSIAGHFPTPQVSAYAASKFAIRGLTKVAALELSRYGIRVNAICPAGGNMEMVMEALSPELRAVLAQRGDALGGATPAPSERSVMEQVAFTAVFLASDDSIGFNGADFMLDGGSTAGDMTMAGLAD